MPLANGKIEISLLNEQVIELVLNIKDAILTLTENNLIGWIEITYQTNRMIICIHIAIEKKKTSRPGVHV